MIKFYFSSKEFVSSICFDSIISGEIKRRNLTFILQNKTLIHFGENNHRKSVFPKTMRFIITRAIFPPVPPALACRTTCIHRNNTAQLFWRRDRNPFEANISSYDVEKVLREIFSDTLIANQSWRNRRVFGETVVFLTKHTYFEKTDVFLAKQTCFWRNILVFGVV